MSIDFQMVEFAQNPEPRCPCILLLDVSGSMSGEPIAALNEGLKTFQQSLREDRLASLRVEVAIIAFGGEPTLVQDFIIVDEFDPPTLEARGGTPMGAAIAMALDELEQRKRLYKQNGISYYRPWVFMITDGAPTDSWQQAAQRVRAAEAKKSVAFFCVGVEGADLQTLAQISPRQPLKLRGLNFREMFLWLSSSLTSTSHSTPGDQVLLPPPTGWGTV